MSSAVVLNENLERNGEIALPEKYKEINAHNLYLYVKSYLAGLRANTAVTKTRAEVSGGGKKPWSQKGRGGARAGSITSPVFVGGGKAHGASFRNYNLKVNKKQKQLAFLYALNEKASQGGLFVVDSVKVESGKTKDASAYISKLDAKDVLVVTENLDEKTYLAFRNLNKCEILDSANLNAYWLSAFKSVVMEKAVFENIVKEG
jgi:large subunit ribosomal protein L4